MTISQEERERRLAAYRATTTDREAAALLGISESAFAWWRRDKEGLPVSRAEMLWRIAVRRSGSRRLVGLKLHMRALVREHGIDAVRAALELVSR